MIAALLHDLMVRRLALQIELGQLQVAGLRDLEIRGRAEHDGDLRAGALDQAGLVGADEFVGFGFGKGAFAEDRSGSPAASAPARCTRAGMVEVMMAPSAVRSTCLMVSTAGRPTMAASCFSTASNRARRWWPRRSGDGRRREPE